MFPVCFVSIRIDSGSQVSCNRQLSTARGPATHQSREQAPSMVGTLPMAEAVCCELPSAAWPVPDATGELADGCSHGVHCSYVSTISNIGLGPR